MQDTTHAVSGPCPKCGAWIDASQFSLEKEMLKGLSARLPSKTTSEHKRSKSIVGGKGSIRADGYLDQDYGERKELYGTIKVLAVSLAVLAAILFVTLYLKQWMTY
ncbi:MAG: hypothetical protein NWT08_08815 [Akkermansiaceae bacterium]|nr:hypothetical protein [Akkermansiaceae bacterium]MDP4648045.1 hypothetical protein [Akkermansiaceae bacterium]MDP4720302.1 hypothetical protein [Akkermansiaceae bacterium]MDP4781393.1 hypothetical protein [Akkermansiaceae bacterium]MDP4847826.1 hypothetical protein [Akkermansiaceae bacterium]